MPTLITANIQRFIETHTHYKNGTIKLSEFLFF